MNVLNQLKESVKRHVSHVNALLVELFEDGKELIIEIGLTCLSNLALDVHDEKDYIL